MRADRLVAIVLLLQAHGQLTAAQLAELLETSERTVRRDLEALGMAGVPVFSQRGRGGGWALLNGHRLDLTGFTEAEARALFVVAGSGPAARGGREPALHSALRKVFAALPEPLREQASAAQQSTVVDPAGWGRSPGPDPPFLDTLRAAVLDRVQVDLEYAKPGGAPSWRRIHPYGLVAKRGVWYLLAGTEHGRRTFRVWRVTGVVRSEEPVVLPEGFELGREWSSAEEDFVRSLRAVEVELEVEQRAVLRLTAGFRGWAEVEEITAPAGGAPAGGVPAGGALQEFAPQEGAPQEGRRRLRVAVPHLRAAAAQLAPFGADVRVVSPAELRHELARIGRELVAANARGSP